MTSHTDPTPTDPDAPCVVCGGARAEHTMTFHEWTAADEPATQPNRPGRGADATLTPGDELRQAADRLNAWIHRWTIEDMDEWLEHVADQTPVAASLLNLLARTPRPLADLLRAEADFLTREGRQVEHAYSGDALEVARAVNAGAPK